MKRKILYFLVVLKFFIFSELNAQLLAPELRCVSVTSPTSAVLSWIIPPDPSNLFTQYQIWSSPVQTGPFVLIGSVNNYTQTTFTQSPTNADLQSQYYYVTTISGTNTSVPSDTLRSLFINFVNNPNGVVTLNWNSQHVPVLPGSSLTYTLSREAPSGIWTTIYTGTKQNYNDTISICRVYYNYKVEVSDNSGCVSVSNIPGDSCFNMQAPNILILDSVSVKNNGETTMGWPPSNSSDVTSYVIYESAGGFLSPIDTIYGRNNTSYTYTSTAAGSGSEGYCIVAADSCGNYSIPSLTHRTMFLKITYDLCSRTASLNWTAYSNLTKAVLRYDVYCSINGAPPVLAGSTTNTSFNHSGLIPDSSYCYTIRVWDTEQLISASSNEACLTANGLPGPSYAYINSVSVNVNKQIEVTFSVDNTNSYKGSNVYKSEDGVHFTKVGFIPSSTVTPFTFHDNDVSPTEKNYFYKIQVADNCDNPGVSSNISKTIILHVSNDSENIFYNNLSWDDYSSWSGGVNSYNIYRAVNGVFDPTPIGNVSALTKYYTDNVQDFVSAQGKFSYYVEAVEGPGNIYGFMDLAKSNPADAYVEVNVFVPNAFAPKGQNNIWLPIAQYVEKTDYKVMVFNRWGDKVFETHSDIEGWTGDAATDEVYVYLIEYKNARGEYIQLKGHLTVIR